MKPAARFALALALIVACPAAPAARPSVLLIMPDDVSFNDVSFFNSHGPRTPHIDGLLRTSVRLAGRYLRRRGETTLADLARRNDYRTGLFGTWHLGDSFPFRPEDRGFDFTAPRAFSSWTTSVWTTS